MCLQRPAHPSNKVKSNIVVMQLNDALRNLLLIPHHIRRYLSNFSLEYIFSKKWRLETKMSLIQMALAQQSVDVRISLLIVISFGCCLSHSKFQSYSEWVVDFRDLQHFSRKTLWLLACHSARAYNGRANLKSINFINKSVKMLVFFSSPVVCGADLLFQIGSLTGIEWLVFQQHVYMKGIRDNNASD